MLATLACSDGAGTCRCGQGPQASTPPQPPEQDPSTVLGAALEVRDGRVTSPSEGIIGRFSLTQSELGSTITLQPGGGDQVCVAGELGVVRDEEWDSRWGAQLNMSFNEAPGSAAMG